MKQKINKVRVIKVAKKADSDFEEISKDKDRGFVELSKKRRNKVIGRLGEDIACQFLMKHGFRVLERNYLRKYGEIDIIALKDDILRFVEVKTVSRENVNHETGDVYRPEDNVDQRKVRKIRRVINGYISEKNLTAISGHDWKFDVVTVVLDYVKHVARVTFYDNLII